MELTYSNVFLSLKDQRPLKDKFDKCEPLWLFELEKVIWENLQEKNKISFELEFVETLEKLQFQIDEKLLPLLLIHLVETAAKLHSDENVAKATKQVLKVLKDWQQTGKVDQKAAEAAARAAWTAARAAWAARAAAWAARAAEAAAWAARAAALAAWAAKAAARAARAAALAAGKNAEAAKKKFWIELSEFFISSLKKRG